MRSLRVSDRNARRDSSSNKPGFRLLLWAAICAFLVGLTGFGDPMENLLRDLRNVARSHPASGRVVVVGIDDRSIGEVGAWPWPRRHYATIVDKLSEAGAKAVFLDVQFSSPSNPEDDEILRRSLAAQEPKVTLPVQVVFDSLTGERSDLLPIDSLKSEADLATINVWHDFRGLVRELPYRREVGGTPYPSMAAKMAGASGRVGETFPIDFAIQPRTIPTVSAVDVLQGRFSRSQFAGKSVLIGATSAQPGDTHLLPGHGLMSGIYLQALGAETLLAGSPLSLGWFLPLLLALPFAGGALLVRDARLGAVLAAVAAGTFFLAGAGLEARAIVPHIVPAVLLLVTVSSALGWSSLKRLYRARGSINAASGLPNLNVLRQEEHGQAMALVVAKIHNYAEITSALSSSGEEKLVQQVAQRLQIVSAQSKLYQGDEGIFAWLFKLERTSAPADHLEALYEIFRQPMLVGDRQVDATVTFGIDGRTEEPLASRLGSAVVAADNALREGVKWKHYDPAQSQDIAWKLSLLSQLDQAVEAGDLWVAFQPKMDVASRTIVGAEALVRWDHPEKGVINPIDFILAAEQSGRIGKLTDHVLARSIEAAAKLNRRGIRFNIAVNLSARLIDGMALSFTISRLLTEHKLDAACLTLEITETAALAGDGRDLEILKDLRKMGIQLSIDDYGTGLSTLDYMKRIPAGEIKIDKSFIEGIDKSRSDRLMVHSTIQLAHSLGQKVVAEGVERAETLQALAMMGCDMAQGYLIGRPVPFDELERSLAKTRQAA